MKFIMLIKVKMTTIVGFETYMYKYAKYNILEFES